MLILSTTSMFCKNCGKELADGITVCEACGTSLEVKEEVQPEEKALENENVTEAEENVDAVETAETQESDQAEETEEADAPSETEGEFANPSFEEEKPKKKSKKGWIIAGVSVVLAAVIGFFVYSNFDSLKGMFIKNFGSDEDYFQFVEYRSVANGIDDLSETYNKVAELVNGEYTSKGSIKLNLSKDAQNLLKSIGGELDLSKLDGINIEVLTASSEDGINLKLSLKNEKDVIADLDFIIDLKNGGIYFGITNVSDKYLGYENPEMSMAFSGLDMFSSMYGTSLEDSLPTMEEVTDFFKKYVNVALENMDNVTSTDEVVEINGVKEELTVLEFKLTEKNAIEIINAVLKELRDDEDIKDFIEENNSLFSLLMLSAMDSTEVSEDVLGSLDMDFYSTYTSAIDELIAKIESEVSGSETVLLSWKDYVNDSHEVVGRNLIVGGVEIINYITVSDGDKFAFDFVCGTLAINGNGTNKGDFINADYDLCVGGNSLITLKVSNYDTDSAEDGYTNGNFKLIPNMDTLSELSGEDIQAGFKQILGAEFVGFEFDIKSSENSSSVSFNMLSDAGVYVGLDIGTSTEFSADIKVPEDNDVISAEDVEEWISTINLDKVLDILSDIGFSNDMIDMIETVIKMYESGLLDDMIDSYGDIYSDYELNSNPIEDGMTAEEYLDDYFDEIEGQEDSSYADNEFLDYLEMLA